VVYKGRYYSQPCPPCHPLHRPFWFLIYVFEAFLCPRPSPSAIPWPSGSGGKEARFYEITFGCSVVVLVACATSEQASYCFIAHRTWCCTAHRTHPPRLYGLQCRLASLTCRAPCKTQRKSLRSQATTVPCMCLPSPTFCTALQSPNLRPWRTKLNQTALPRPAGALSCHLQRLLLS
jgi:hypothetical protein